MSTKLWKPMLAAKPDPKELDSVLATLPFPALFSPKFDGIRCTVQDGKLYSRSLKLIPNLEMQKKWGHKDFDGLDGEIIVGPPTAADCFNRSTSTVMSRDKSAKDAVFYVFDHYHSWWPFSKRSDFLEQLVDEERGVEAVEQTYINSAKELARYERDMLHLGHEGIMRRSTYGLYKNGRSTLKEQGLIAIKRFVDAEAVILDVYEQEENTNEKKLNELGKMQRTSHKAGKVGKNTLGGFKVQALDDGQLFNVATGKGLTDAVRKVLWATKETLPGKVVKFRYQAVGTKDAPRIPTFVGFRDRKDM